MAAPEPLRLVQAFVNSCDIEDGIEAFATVESFQAWMEHHGLAAPELAYTEADRLRAIAVREALRDLMDEHREDDEAAGAAARLHAALGDVPLTVAFGPDAKPQLVSRGTGLDAALGRLLAVVSTASVDGTWDRLKTCRNDACRWAFYDASKNRSGVWCSMAICGSKMKARAYRTRLASRAR